MNGAVVNAAKRHNVLVARLATHRARLHEAQVVGVGVSSPANDTGLSGDESQMLLAATAARFGCGEGVVTVNAVRSNWVLQSRSAVAKRAQPPIAVAVFRHEDARMPKLPAGDARGTRHGLAPRKNSFDHGRRCVHTEEVLGVVILGRPTVACQKAESPCA